jgi:short-subunit dehydrogenase
MSASRQYDLVVFGATGYTGKLTAEHIATSLPTDLRWALAGRSQSKLEAVAAECKALNSDRIQPGEHFSPDSFSCIFFRHVDHVCEES